MLRALLGIGKVLLMDVKLTDPALTAPRKRPRTLERYGLAIALAGVALLIRKMLPVPEGTTIYQLPLAAVVLSGWYGGRGPGLASLLTCSAGILYWFIPPADSFQLHPDYVLAFAIFIGLGWLLIEFSGARRRVQHALQGSDERFRTLVQFSFDVYWETDAAHRFTNVEFSDRLPHAPARGALIGKTPWEVPYVEPDEEGWRQYRATVDAHLPYRDFEIARPTADGGVRYISASAIPAFDENGRFAGYRGVGRHITERKRAEAEHRAHLWFLESMDRVNRAMQANNDVERMMSDVLAAVLEVFACDRAWLLYPCDPHALSWRAVMEQTRPEFPGAAARGRDLPMTADSAEVARAALECDGALPAGPGHERQVKPEIAEHFGVRSEMLMALHPKGDRPYLFGLHQCSGPRAWTKDEQRLFQEVGHRLTDALSSLIALRSLRESEARFRTFVDHATDAFFLHDDERLTLVDVNRQACENLGYSRDELIGMHPRAFDVGLDGTAILRLVERVGAGETVTFETLHRRKDGSVFPVEIRARRFQHRDSLFRLSLARDITDRKRAEESLRQSEAYLAEAQRLSHTGSWALDVATNKYIYTSDEFDRMYGFDTRAQPLTREVVVERIHPEDRSSWKQTLEKSRREKVDSFHEYRIVLPDGDVRHIHVVRHPVLNDAGDVVQLVGTAIDITERKLAEEALQAKDNALHAARTELARVSRLTTLGELTASIAHEVGQPLAAMTASAGACSRWLAAEPPDMAEARAALDNIVADAKRAREVIGRIRALAKRETPRNDRLDINHQVQEVLALTAQELRSHAVVVRTQLEPTMPPVMGDRVQLQQVLLNLIVNAIDAMSGIHDRPRELTIVSQRDGDSAVVVEVRDAGTGLDPGRAEHVFEAFYTTKTEGLGIGLSISRSIVEAHGGRLWASSNEPHGAVFRFSLPVAEDE